ncbi:ABC transporter ATP-binding protein [Gracilinema caldarium]|uniref:Sulfate-transporting ATPase n=1 Tax=Gracilinema caldarium (strain ATCC 51460 / DSM 7334 / H1) TaxID=744872 RepID=F8F157_GRAC1|nr:ATP-binding cassette domain-containing protein [Gracilinema caldarium]AEJ20847.1 Sulfate-transporting ATPase [Gracilinema caldarium DSM 7334]
MILKIENLYKTFGEKKVLSGVDLEIPEKSICSVVGQSGTGKSVLLKCILGMITPDSGKVWYRDAELTSLSHDALINIRKHFGYAFQNAALFDSMTVGENLEFPLREVLQLKNKVKIKKRVAEILEWIELPGIEHMHPSDLSGGMRKRVGVARALMLQPEVLFFDEPTTGLDPVLSETIMNLVIRVNKELGVTCLLITHDIPAAFRISDRIAFLHKGHIVADGTPKEVSLSEKDIVKEFLRISFNELKV